MDATVRAERNESFQRLAAEVEPWLAACELCERRCGVNRLQGERGFCGLDRHARCFSEGLNLGEIDCPSPTHTVYLAGCGLRCLGCWARTENAARVATDSTLPERLAARIRGRAASARSLAFIGGSPDANLLAILAALAPVPAPPPIVWNSELYATPPVVALLARFVDRFVIDLKFGNDSCAAALCAAPRYTEVLHRNLRQLRDRDLVVRHLLLPGHGACCAEPVIRWVAEHLPAARFHLLANFRPFGGPLAGARVAADELRRVETALARTRLERVA